MKSISPFFISCLLLTLIISCADNPSNSGNSRPIITSEPGSMEWRINRSSIYKDTISAHDPDNDSLSFSVLSGGDGAYFIDSILVWPVSIDYPQDSIVFTIRVSDGKNGFDTLTWNVVLINAPVFLDSPSDMINSAMVDSLYCDTLHANGNGAFSLEYSRIAGPSGIVITDSILQWRPALGDTGTREVAVRVSNRSGGYDTLSWRIKVVVRNLIRGFLLLPDGRPASGARVLFYSSDDAVFPFCKVKDSSLTDSSGQFALAYSDTGNYTILSSYSSYLSVQCSVTVSLPGIYFLPWDTLKPPGGIFGAVSLPLGGDPRTVTIVAVGLPYYSQCIDSTGGFSFPSLPEGKYSLRFVSTLALYKPLDINVHVVSDNLTYVGSISLPIKTP